MSKLLLFRKDNHAFIMSCDHDTLLEYEFRTKVEFYCWQPGTLVPDELRELYGDDPVAGLSRRKYRAPDQLLEYFFHLSSVMDYMRHRWTTEPDAVLTIEEVMKATSR